MAVNKLETSLTIKANVKGANEVNALAQSLDGVNNELINTARPANTASQAIDGLGDQMSKSAQSADHLGNSMKSMAGGLAGLMGALGLSIGVQEVIQLSDEFNNLEARVRLATQSGGDFAHAMSSIKDIADSTMMPLTATGDLFGKLTQATKELGYSQSDVLGLTKTISQAMAVSGGDMASMEAGLTQLAQGLSAGALRGDEFNSVVEQSPRLAQAMADGLGVSIGQLRVMAGEGKLTAEVVGNALKSQADVIAKEFAQMPQTVSGSLTVLKNSLMGFIGELDNEIQGSGGLSNFILDIANNINNIDPSVIDGLKNSLASVGEVAKVLLDSIAVIPNTLGDVVVAIAGLEASSGQIGLLQGFMNGLALTTGAVADGFKGLQFLIVSFMAGLQGAISTLANAMYKLTGLGGEFAKSMTASANKTGAELRRLALQFESSLGRAIDGMGKTNEDKLKEVANTARQKYEQMAQDGQASATALENAFKDYAHKAIQANDGVVDSTLKQELAQRNLQAVTDETGKVIISSMDKAKKAVDGVDLSKHAESFKALGIDMGEFAGGLSSKANSALTAFNDLAGVAGTNVTQLAMAYNGAKQAIGDNATALAELDNALLQATNDNTELANAIKDTAKAQELAKQGANAHAKALAELGINMSAINQGMSDGGQKIAQSLNLGLTAIKNTATSATALKTALAQAFDTATAKAQTTADFTAIKTAIEQAGLASHLTADQIKTLNTGMMGGSQAVKQALADETKARQAVTTATDTQTKATTDNTTATQANATAKTELATATDKATQATEKQAVSEQKASAGTPYFVANMRNKILALSELGASTERLNQVNSSLYDSLNGMTFGTLGNMVAAMERVNQGVEKQIEGFKRTSQQVDDYTKRLSSASVSAEDLAIAQNVLANATSASINGINVMDKARLDNLKAQIDSTKAKFHELDDVARSVADNLEGELARMQGNDKKALELENAQKLADLEKKLTEARQRGNAGEITQLERALNLQQQINQEKMRKIQESETQKAEQAKKEQEQRQTPSRQSAQNSNYDPSGLAREVADSWEKRLQEAEERGAKRGAEELVKRLASEGKRRAY